MDGKLHRNVETVQDVSPKHQSVLRSVDSMDPALVANVNKRKRDIKRMHCTLTLLTVLHHSQEKLSTDVH